MTQSTWLSTGMARSSHLLVVSLLGLASAACAGGTDGKSGSLDNLVDEDGIAEDFDGNPAITEDSVSAEEEAKTQDEGEESVGSTQQAIVGLNACKPINIKVRNSRDRNGVQYEIKVRYVKFWNVDDGRWREEGLSNQDLPHGTQWTWLDQSLGDTKDDRISAWRVYYSYKVAGQNWSDTVYQEVYPMNYNPDRNYCYANGTYTLTVE
jgi:hypothetical protein